MKVKVVLLAAALVITTGAASAQRPLEFRFVQSGSSAQESAAYDAGKAAINDGDYEKAVAQFEKAAVMKGPNAAGALYWKAYALKKLGRIAEMRNTIAQLKKEYPDSRWNRDADRLMLDLKHEGSGSGGGSGSGSGSGSGGGYGYDKETGDTNTVHNEVIVTNGCGDEDLKDYALFQLMNNNPDEAVPVIEKVLAGNCSDKLKEKALFLLAQSGNDKAFSIVLKIARGDSASRLQKKAIENLGIAGRRKELEDIYRSTSSQNVKLWVFNGYVVSGCSACFLEAAKNDADPVIQKKAIEGLGVNGAKQELRDLYKSATTKEKKKYILQAYIVDGDSDAFLDVAKTEQDPELRKKAIEGLGVNGRCGLLRDLYKTAGSPEMKRDILNAFVICGDAGAFVEVANTETDPVIRKKAIEDIGTQSGHAAAPALLALYERYPDADTRNAVLNGLFINNAAHELVELAKREKDPAMKKKIVEKLSIMGGKEARDYMISILDEKE